MTIEINSELAALVKWLMSPKPIYEPAIPGTMLCIGRTPPVEEIEPGEFLHYRDKPSPPWQHTDRCFVHWREKDEELLCLFWETDDGFYCRFLTLWQTRKFRSIAGF